ncbi:hypothetical protein B1B05_05550 [Domibacillus enclensis]|uniref:Uncharacterized protein n=1 Tax=Domibacillus enclensis TaxID=1017273 RepID=A0ABX4EB53_9BACI|nr:hypothetical protein B1B05_05550 [Domibacillus enclensis]
MLAPTQSGRLLQDFAFGGAGGELTFVATLQKWISPAPLIPAESSSCASRPGGEEKPLSKSKKERNERGIKDDSALYVKEEKLLLIQPLVRH